MKTLAVINSDSMECSYGGVAPFMRNMHPYFANNFNVEYYYIPSNWNRVPIPGRIKIMLYLWIKRNRLKRCDFILSHIPEGSYVVSFFNVPYAHIFHGNDNPMTQSRYKIGKYFGPMFDYFFRRIEKTASLKYTVGPAFRDRKKLFNPICHNFKPLNINQKSGFIFAGRLELIKNIDRLITIYSKLPIEIIRENHFYIAGYGTQEKALKELVSKIALNEYVHFLGNMPNLALIKEDQSKKILIMASTQEGLPTAIAEALSVGVPVITTNPGDIGLVIKNDYNGYIFPLEFSDEDYIAAIISVLNNYERFSMSALESSKVFEAKKITADIINDIRMYTDI
jgi:glycosyltransferase involved in cell wall biosynthesis